MNIECCRVEKNEKIYECMHPAGTHDSFKVKKHPRIEHICLSPMYVCVFVDEACKV